MYDIFLYSGCQELPDFSRAGGSIPNLFEGGRRNLVLEKRPGFLGLDLSQEAAFVVLRLLQSKWARGVVAPSQYRNPKITEEEAERIATVFLARKQAEEFPGVRFEPVGFCYETAMWWTFGASSPEWTQAGFSPGALYASVDKLDGHIWQPEDMERFGLEHEKLLAEAARDAA